MSDYRRAADLAEARERQADAIAAARDRVVEAALKENRAFVDWMTSTAIKRLSDHKEIILEYRRAVRDLDALMTKAKEGG